LLKTRSKLKAGLVAIAALATLALVPPGAGASCDGGGLTPAEVDMCTPTPKARLLANGMLIPPQSAPPRVKAVIAAANKIRTKPYIYGGGHARWWDKGYDCSGSVSYALHGGKFLESQLRPRLRGDRRLPLGHVGQHRRQNRPKLARRPARQRRLRRPPPGRLLNELRGSAFLRAGFARKANL